MQNAYIHAEMLATMQDSPERRKHLGVGGHNGTYTACPDYVGNLNPVYHLLPSCMRCFSARINGEYVDSDGTEIQNENRFRRYKTVATVTANLANGKPISAVTMVKEGEEHVFIAIEMGELIQLTLDEPQETSIGACFHRTTIVGTTLMGEGWEKEIKRECVLLPSIQSNGAPKPANERKYLVIASDWSLLRRDGRFGLLCI